MNASVSDKSSANGGDSVSPTQANPAQPTPQEAREKLVDDMKAVIGEAETWLKNSATDNGADLGAIREKVETTLQTAKADLGKLQANMLAKTRQAAQATDVYVKDNPWTSVGIGAAIGLFFGMLFSRK
ncbi:MAG TPA: DUF883 domain-containing protein [Janthinobacterium sp.]|jgi:ElaB/YqjD/DUF883 family membrane-anchored ribosome-binding protein|nr:DUF883 domain-containing protein [Janthinobacterium sp.]